MNVSNLDLKYDTFEPILNELVARFQKSTLANHNDNSVEATATLVSFAAFLDANDQLASLQEAFYRPSTAYLCGHSLGLCSKKSQRYVNEEMEKWQTRGVLGHFSGKRPWVSIDNVLHPHLELLCGACPGEVIAMNSLSVNLNLLLVTFYNPIGKRKKIAVEKMCFPSDFYAVQSQLKLHNNDPVGDLIQLDVDTHTIVSYIETHHEELALILLPGVQYYSGVLLDIPEITKAAKQHKVVIGWDLAHAIGNVPLFLSDWDIDFAVWCSYKYLNGGPGAIGGIYVNRRHHNQFYFSTPTKENDVMAGASGSNKILLGWWGHRLETRFNMDNQFDPHISAHVFKNSNPDVLSIMSLKASLEIIADTSQWVDQHAGYPLDLSNQSGDNSMIKYSKTQLQLREKSILLTGYLEYLVNHYYPKQSGGKALITIITPNRICARGSQLSLLFPTSTLDVGRLCDDLEKEDVIVDYRKPDVIRVAPVAAYCSFSDVYIFVEKLRQMIGRQIHIL